MRLKNIISSGNKRPYKDNLRVFAKVFVYLVFAETRFQNRDYSAFVKKHGRGL